jgi:hypothetical protein
LADLGGPAEKRVVIICAGLSSLFGIRPSYYIA